MRAEDLDKFTEKELQDKANTCFIVAENTNIHLQGGETERLRLQLEAQYYLTLIARKRDDRVARRDFGMEVAVIVLIGLEIILSFIFGSYGLKEGNQQATILQHMDQSTAKTADAIKGQGKILETMNQNTGDTVAAMQKLQSQQNDSLSAQKNSLATLRNTLKSITQMDAALERQLNLAFEVSVVIMADNDKKRISVVNQGKTAVIVWGVKYDIESPVKFEAPRFIVPGATYQFFVENLFTKISLLVPRDSERSFPLDLYMRSADGKPYVAHGVLTGRWEKDELKVYSTTTSITQTEWPDGVQ